MDEFNTPNICIVSFMKKKRERKRREEREREKKEEKKEIDVRNLSFIPLSHHLNLLYFNSLKFILQQAIGSIYLLILKPKIFKMIIIIQTIFKVISF